MPDDVARLLSLNTGLILFVIAIITLSTWGILHEMEAISRSTEMAVGMAERLEARLRRQSADIDRELQDRKEWSGETGGTGICWLPTQS